MNNEEYLLDPYTVYKEYITVKLHFTQKSFNMYKFNNKTRRITRDAYDRRKDKVEFMHLAKAFSPDEIRNFFISQFIECSNLYIRDIVLCVPLAKSIYNKWVERKNHIRENYQHDIDLIKETSSDWVELFSSVDKNYPKIFRMVTSGIIAPETYSLMNDLFKQCDKKYDVVSQKLFDSVQFKFKRYRDCLNIKSTDVLSWTPKKLN